VNKNLSNDAYYQALNDAIYAALAPLEDIRKDSAIRLLLGGIIGKGAYEISQEINMDYMTLLKNLDKIAKGYGRRYFFSTNVNDTAEDIIATWENSWDIEVLIRELKVLGLEKGSFLTWLRNKGFIVLKAFSLFVVLLFKYFTGLNLGAKRIARLIKSIYQASEDKEIV
jgi:hypothetical protein